MGTDWVLGLPLVLVFVGVLVAQSMAPGMVRDQARALAEKLGRPVEVGDISLSVFGLFVEVRDVRVGPPKAAQDAEAEREGEASEERAGRDGLADGPPAGPSLEREPPWPSELCALICRFGETSWVPVKLSLSTRLCLRGWT